MKNKYDTKANQSWAGSNVSFYHKRMQVAELNMTQVRMKQCTHHPHWKKYITQVFIFQLIPVHY